MKKEIKDIKRLKRLIRISGARFSGNEEEMINFLALRILELFEKQRQEIIEKIENMEIAEYGGTKISAYLKRSAKLKE